MKTRAWLTAGLLCLGIAPGCGSGDSGASPSPPLDAGSADGATADQLASEGGAPDSSLDGPGPGIDSSPTSDANGNEAALDAPSGACAPFYTDTIMAGILGDIALDANNVYFMTGQALVSCPKSGCGAQPQMFAQSQDGPVVLDGTTLYWVNPALSVAEILSCAAPACSGTPGVVATSSNPQTLAVGGGHAYWLDAYGEIRTCSTSGGCPPGGSVFWSDSQPNIIGNVVADAAHLYWTDMTTLYSSPFGATASPATVSSDATVALGAYLALDATSVYWGTFRSGASNGIYACAKTGCTKPTTIFTDMGNFLPISVDDTSVYFGHNAGVYRCPKTGCSGPPALLMSTQGGPTNFAVDSANLYVGGAGTTGQSIGQLWVCAK
jgi:hypothetical protein